MSSCESYAVRWLRWPGVGASALPPIGAILRHPQALPPTTCGPGASFDAEATLSPPIVQCTSTALAPMQPATSAVPANVLLAVSDGSAPGILGQVAAVLDQLLVASERGLVAHVLLGRRHFAAERACDNALYQQELGENVWDYFFRQVGPYTLGAPFLAARPVRVLVAPDAKRGRTFAARVASLSPAICEQSALLGRAWALSSAAEGTARASELVARARQVWRWLRPLPWVLRATEELLEKVDGGWGTAERPVLGVLVRDVAARGGGAEAAVEWPLVHSCIDAALQALPYPGNDPLPVVLLGASEAEAAALRRRRLPRRAEVISLSGADAFLVAARAAAARAGTTVTPTLTPTLTPTVAGVEGGSNFGNSSRLAGHLSAVQGRGSGVANATAELLAAMVLAHCDRLLTVPSLLADFARWFNPALLRAHTQIGPRCAEGGENPRGAARAPAANDDEARELRLLPLSSKARAAAMRSALTSRERSSPVAEVGGQGRELGFTPGLEPPEARVVRAPPPPWVVVDNGRGCSSASGRLMSEAECRQYAQGTQLHYIGSGVEKAEYPGCVIWEGARVEYNAHTDERGGCALGTRGKCACWKRS